MILLPLNSYPTNGHLCQSSKLIAWCRPTAADIVKPRIPTAYPTCYKSSPTNSPMNIEILFVAGFGPITTDSAQSRALYQQTFGIPFDVTPDGYVHTQKLAGTKYFALWPLEQAAESCFGVSAW